MSSEWRQVNLKEVTSILGDGLHGTPEYDENGDYFFINGNNLGSGRIVFNDTTKRVSFDEFNKHKKNLTNRTILVSINGTIGNVAFYNNEKVVLGKSACYFNVLDSVDKHFVRYVLESKIFQDYIENLATGSTIKNVSLKLMRDFQFRLPPIALQQRISEILSYLDDRIALLRETNATLEAIAQALFKSWFVDFDPVRAKMEGRVPEGMDEATAALFPDGLVESELGPVPAGWVVKMLSDAFEVNPKRFLKKGLMAPYLDMASLATSGHCVEPPVQREMGSGTKFCNGDTLLARITPCLENGKSAFVDFLADGQIGWGSTEFVVLRPIAPLPEFFGYLLCRHHPFREYAINSMSGTSGRQRIQNDVLGRYLLTLPDEAVASVFGKIIEPIQRSIAGNHRTAHTLASLRDTLLPRLISGQLRLPELHTFIESATV